MHVMYAYGSQHHWKNVPLLQSSYVPGAYQRRTLVDYFLTLLEYPSAKLKMIPLSISSKRPQYELSTIILLMAAILHYLRSIRAGK